MSSELARIAALQTIFARADPRIALAIGDDAAVIAPDLVWTVDAQVEGTHFRLAWLSWEDVGYRSFMAAASDLAAMGAKPLAALSSLVLAPNVDDEALAAITRGQALASDRVGAPVIGGNLARGTETSVTTTLLGRAAKPIPRSGARPGDSLWLAGSVGLAAEGLRALATMQTAPIDAIAAWRRPNALVEAGLAMAGRAHAAIDVSDGLARDLAHLVQSSGVRAVLETEFDADALHGGEDYALVAAGPVPIPGFLRIGRIESGLPGVFYDRCGELVEVEARGFDHFEIG